MPRPAGEADLGAVARLYHDVWHETHAGFMPGEEARLRTPAFFLERMTALLSTTVVVEREGGVIGFAAWSGHLLGQIYVHASHRGSGVAVALLSEAERRMADEGIATSELHCVVGNARARRFYERMGWTHVGSVTEAVAGPNGPVAVEFWCMTKALIPIGGHSSG
ncbi:MAG: GNAT family N-acetyltransferase [Rhizobiales bacterium]|nr:GNAT family N-acetyltransferase [Hyphomicrobiales bacterium]